MTAWPRRLPGVMHPAEYILQGRKKEKPAQKEAGVSMARESPALLPDHHQPAGVSDVVNNGYPGGDSRPVHMSCRAWQCAGEKAVPAVGWTTVGSRGRGWGEHTYSSAQFQPYTHSYAY